MPSSVKIYKRNIKILFKLFLISEDLASGSGHRCEFAIMFVPNKSLLCEMRLTDRGVLGSFSYLDELAISWFPLETDVISLEKM
jgi:hypothetical protein